MYALDTNIIARFFIIDENDFEAQKQHKIAKKIIDEPRENYVSFTVILEFVWVMQNLYDLSKDDVLLVLNKLISLPHIYVENKVKLQLVLSYFQKGMDFADALHLVQADHCQQLLTFDKKFIKKSASIGSAVPVVEPT